VPAAMTPHEAANPIPMHRVDSDEDPDAGNTDNDPKSTAPKQ